MKSVRCPYLGIKDDSGTALGFPSDGNFCHRPSSPAPVRLNYQQYTCLTERHARCPVFTAAPEKPFPPALKPSPVLRMPSQRRLALVGFPLLAFILAVLGTVLVTNAGWFGKINLFAANQDNGSQEASGFRLFSFSSDETPVPLIIPNTSGQQKQTTCPIPEGWVTYTVLPTDSLDRLSITFRIPVEVLRQVNCLGNETALMPGQVIYVPSSTELAPSPTSAATGQPAVQGITPQVVIITPVQVDTATDQPTVVVIPTNVPVTVVPPTNIPPTATVQLPTATDILPTPTIQTPTEVVPSPTATIQPPTATPAPTDIPPTQTPTPTEQPLSTTDLITISKNGLNSTIACSNGESVTVISNNNTLTLSSTCSSLTVIGNNNFITVSAGTPVNNTGKNNMINFI